MQINKIIVVEGLDKTGKSTFCNEFAIAYSGLIDTSSNILKPFSFPNNLTPIGKTIRDQLTTLNPDTKVVNSANFLADMAHYWMLELFNMHYVNSSLKSDNTNKINVSKVEDVKVNYLFDRYFISTLAYQAFFNNSQSNLEFIKTALRKNAFIKMPTDIIMFDLPNSVIIERTLADQEKGLVDAHDTLDLDIINKRRDAYKQAIHFLKGLGINVHWFDDVSKYTSEDLAKILIGKIFN